MSRKIILCGSCSGYGNIKTRVYDGPRDSSWDVIECSRCNGSGRLEIETIENTKPFKYNFEKHRHNL